MNSIKDRISGHNGWADIIHSKLFDSVTGLIKAGMDKESALRIAFNASCASEAIKHQIEKEIMG